MIDIKTATSQSDFIQIGHFYRSFGDWLKLTYPEILHLFGNFFIELEQEIASLPGIYSPPTGCLLIATVDDIPAGTVGLANLDENTCQMRRMFVDSQFRGAKVGRALATAIITEARNRGYTKMRLGTLPRHYAALGLYRSLGFQAVNEARNAAEVAGHDIPDDLKGGRISMALDL